MGRAAPRCFVGDHSLLPADKARYAGEAVAMVVAGTRAQARDAAEAVFVDYGALPAVTDTASAAGPDAPIVWDGRPDNILVETFFGDEAGTEAAFAEAAHVVGRRFVVPRVTGCPLEPRSALAEYDPATGRYTVHAGSGGAVRQKREIAAVLGVEPDRVRIHAYDVGGNFGTRNRCYVEFPLVAWAARKLGRPVKCTVDRGEALISDYQGRDLVTEIALAFDKDGTILGLRGENLSNCRGALRLAVAAVEGVRHRDGLLPRAGRAVAIARDLSNTPPTNAYRSSGRPECIFAIERLIEIAAEKLGIDALELRRRNLVAPDEMPYRNAVGMTMTAASTGRAST